MNMQPTNEQWAEIKEKLEHLHDFVYLDCDGYCVTAYLTRITKMKLGIVVFVNGVFRGEWLWASKPSEEGRRFFPLRRRPCYSAAAKRDFEKRFGKREVAESDFLHATYEFRSSYWTSAASLIRHLKAENERITLLDPEEGYRRNKAFADERLRASAPPRETEEG